MSRLAARRFRSRRLRLEHLEDRRLLAVVPSGFTETVLAGSLTSPTTLDIAPDGRVWVAYQDGRIEVIEDGTPGTTLAFQLDCDGSAEHGLQGLELDPDFETNGYIYVYYTANSPSPHNRLSRLTVNPTTENTILPGSEVALLDLPNLSEYGNPPWHIGGAVHFGLDGTLYVQIGESQQSAQSQDLDSPLGKILHLNADGTPAANNPYLNSSDGISWRDYVWASGLRNPFAGDLNPVTGQYFVADVGAGSWEEINDATLPGLNFGWPTTEGAFNQANFPDFTQPFYAYSHADGCAITGGAFNNGGLFAFPNEYQGKFFFAEFCGNEIRVIDPADPTDVSVFATGADFPMNIEFGPDGSMYYISRGAGAGGAPGIGTGSVRKVSFVANIPPSIAVPPADQLVSVGYDATFAAAAFGSAPLVYQWQVSTGGPFTDIPGAIGETLVVAAAQLGDSGNQYRVVASNAFGTAVSSTATLTVTADTPPTPMISMPPAGSTYRAGDLIAFSGGATDLEDGQLAAAQLTWRVDFHHNVHSHPFLPPTSGLTGAQFTVPTATETDSDVFYRITLTATDSAGLVTITHRDVLPLKSDFVVETNLPDGGGNIVVDDHAVGAPFATTGVENVERTFQAPQFLASPSGSVTFSQWLDGETARSRTINTPQDDTAYVALYTTLAGSAVYLSDLPTASTPTNGWGPIERDTSNGEDAAGDGNPITLDGIVYDKGLGVHAPSEIVYDLNGQYGRFLADVGVDDENDPGGTVVFRVLVDGVEQFNSGVMTNASATQTVDVNLAGANEVRLIVDNAGDGNGNDHADWADARLIAASTPLVDVNFQLDGTPIPSGYLEDTGLVFADRDNGWSYGWSSDHTDVSRDRDVNSDQRLDTLVHFHGGAEWEISLPNGVYEVTASIGDAGFPSDHTLNVEGLSYWSDTALAADEFATRTELVSVTDGRLTLDQGAAVDKATRINYLRIAVPAAESTLLPFSAADIDLNTRLDLNDVLAFAAGWGVDGTSFDVETQVRHGDLDFDGDTEADDFTVLNARWIAEGNAPLNLNAVLTPLDGDFNRTGLVAAADLAVWNFDYGSTTQLAADGDSSAQVDGGDFLLWQRNLGASNGEAPLLDNLVLSIDRTTGAAQLRNETASTISLVGYSIVSSNSALLPTDGNWNSLEDQGLPGWNEAAPSSSALSELNPTMALTLTSGERRSLGQVVAMGTVDSEFSLEYAVDGAVEIQDGLVVFAEVAPAAEVTVAASVFDQSEAGSVPASTVATFAEPNSTPFELASLAQVRDILLNAQRDDAAHRAVSRRSVPIRVSLHDVDNETATRPVRESLPFGHPDETINRLGHSHSVANQSQATLDELDAAFESVPSFRRSSLI